MPTIKHITAREILNAKGNPAVETTIVLDNDLTATASVPSGTSVSSYEAVDLKDGDERRFGGNGVLKAIHNVTDVISPALVGKDPTNQAEIDTLMNNLDGTPNKATLGANAILSVSVAVSKIAALSDNTPLFKYIGHLANNTSFAIPTPLFNLINGGLHAVGTLDFQEFIIVPDKTTSFIHSLEMAHAIRKTLEKMLVLNNLSTLMGDEGGFSPAFKGNTQALQFLKEAVEETGYHLTEHVYLGLDAAASSFHQNGKYHLKEKGLTYTTTEMIGFYRSLIQEFNLKYVEDPLAEDDWDGWQEIERDLPKSTMIVGDDLISTNLARHKMAIDKSILSAIIVKPNQVGTITETLEVVKEAKNAGLKIAVSHRSGETNDHFIADFAVGIGADFCKFGAPVRGERVAKYNRLLQIEKELM